MKLYSWNVNGLRAIINKNALQNFLEKEQPDVLCLQEIKCKPDQIDFDFGTYGYRVYWNPAQKAGYSGTAVLVKNSLDCEIVDLPNTPNYDLAREEGRILSLDFQDFRLANVYTPNSKPDLSRLELRHKKWDPDYLKLLQSSSKPIITCGDFNAAHTENDIARPKTNHHSAGFTDEERAGISNLLAAGYIDTFRYLNPTSIRYTWWSHWGHARENNVGWRIDYFFIDQKLNSKLQKAEIYEHYCGSDHCPISIEMEF